MRRVGRPRDARESKSRKRAANAQKIYVLGGGGDRGARLDSTASTWVLDVDLDLGIAGRGPGTPWSLEQTNEFDRANGRVPMLDVRGTVGRRSKSWAGGERVRRRCWQAFRSLGQGGWTVDVMQMADGWTGVEAEVEAKSSIRMC